jgi:hypothetical protein
MRPFDAPVIASRKLYVKGRARKATLTIRMPVQVSPGEWWCAFHVTGMGRTRRVIGGDAVQALIIALQALRAYMNETPYRYTWLGEPFDHGIPQMVPWGFGPHWAGHIECAIDRELTKFVQAELRRRRARRRREGKE